MNLDFSLVSGPMAGVTDPVFRSICSRFGATLTVTEMVSAKGLFYKSENTAELLEPSGVHPEAAQIFGSDPEIMAAQLSLPCFEPFDAIDINMGCPARKIVSNGEGSALMRDIPLAEDIISACVSATNKPVTVKMRLGWDSFCADKLAKAAERAGAKAIAVHGRTAVQGYSGKADWSGIRRVKESVNIPVIGNGDVVDGSSAEKMLNETNCDGIMVGRAAQGRPWIFSEILAFFGKKNFVISINEKLDIALEHGERLAAVRGEHTAMLQMRKHIAWYTHGFHNAAKIRGSMQNIETLDDFRRVIEYLRGL